MYNCNYSCNETLSKTNKCQNAHANVYVMCDALHMSIFLSTTVYIIFLWIAALIWVH